MSHTLNDLQLQWLDLLNNLSGNRCQHLIGFDPKSILDNRKELENYLEAVDIDLLIQLHQLIKHATQQNKEEPPLEDMLLCRANPASAAKTPEVDRLIFSCLENYTNTSLPFKVTSTNNTTFKLSLHADTNKHGMPAPSSALIGKNLQDASILQYLTSATCVSEIVFCDFSLEDLMIKLQSLLNTNHGLQHLSIKLNNAELENLFQTLATKDYAAFYQNAKTLRDKADKLFELRREPFTSALKQIHNIAAALAPNCSAEARSDYYELLRDYQQLISTLRAYALDATALRFEEVKAAIKKAQSYQPAHRTVEITSLLAAINGLCLQAARLGEDDGLKTQTREKFEKHGLKGDHQDNYFTYGVMAGLIGYLRQFIHESTDKLSSRELDFIDTAYHHLLDLIENCSHLELRLQALETVKSLFSKNNLVDRDIPNDKKIHRLCKIDLAIMNSLTSNHDGGIALIQRRAQVHRLFLDAITMARKPYRKKAAETDPEAEYMSAHHDQLIAQIRKMDAELSGIRFSDIISETEKKPKDKPLTTTLDPAATFATTNLHNNHAAHCYYMILIITIGSFEYALDNHSNQGMILATDEVNSQRFTRVKDLLELKLRFINYYIEFDKQCNAHEDIKTLTHPCFAQSDINKIAEVLRIANDRVGEQQKKHEKILKQELKASERLKELYAKKKAKLPKKSQNKNNKSTSKEKSTPQDSESTLQVKEDDIKFANALDLIQKGEFKQAEKTALAKLRELPEIDKHHRALWLAQLGNIYAAWGNHLTHSDTTAIAAKVKVASDYYRKASELCDQEDNEDDSLRFFIHDELTQLGGTLEWHAKSLAQEAERAYQYHQYKTALAKLLPALKSNPNDKDLTLRVADCHERLGQTQEAIRLLEHFSQSTHPEVKLKLASLYSNQRQFEKAAQYFTDLRDETSPSWRKAYLRFLYQAKNYSELQLELDKLANSKNKNSPLSRYLLAWYSYLLGDTKLAKKHFEVLSKIAPDNIKYQSHYAIFLAEAGEFAQAHGIVETLLKKYPHDISAQITQAEILAKQQNPLALEKIAAVIQEYPDYFYAYLREIGILKRLGMRKQLDEALNRLADLRTHNLEYAMTYISHHRHPSATVIAEIEKHFPFLRKSHPPKYSESKQTAPAVYKARVVEKSELSITVKKIPSELTALLTQFREQGIDAYVYDDCARRLIKGERLEVISVVVFTNKRAEDLSLMRNLTPSQHLANLYRGKLAALNLYVKVQPAAQPHKEFVSTLGITANSFLIDADGKILDALEKYEQVFSHGISEILLPAIKKSAIVVLQAINAHAIHGTHYGREDEALLAQHVPALANVEPVQIMTECRKAIHSRRLAVICQDWLRFGVLETLMPALKICRQNMPNFNASFQQHVLSAAQYFDSITNSDANLVAAFFSLVLSTTLNVADPNYFLYIHQALEAAPLFKALYETEKTTILHNLASHANTFQLHYAQAATALMFAPGNAMPAMRPLPLPTPVPYSGMG